MTDACPLCGEREENLLWRDGNCRVILAADPDYAGFCRVIWNDHVKEMTDLPASARTHFMEVVFVVEEVLRFLMRPDKVNLASLGNQVPHLHWHVIPRFTDDAKFPDAIWAPPRRPGARRKADVSAIAAALSKRLASKQ